MELFTDDLAIYIITRNQRVATRPLQGVTNKLDACCRNEEPREFMLRNEIIPSKESIFFLEMTLDNKFYWEEHINKYRAKSKSIKYCKSGSRKVKERRSESP